MWAVFEYIKAEWSVIKGAPLAFVGLTVIALMGGFMGGMFVRSQEIANFESLIRLKDGELEGYRKVIDERLNAVEKALSAQQIKDIQSSLERTPSSVEIVKSPAIGPVGDQLETVFKRSGWSVITAVGPTVSGPSKEVVMKTTSTEGAGAIGKALTDAGVKFEKNIGGGHYQFQVMEPQ